MQITDFNINEEKIFKMVSGKGGNLEALYEKLIERKFSIGDTGIPRNILQHWQSEKLLPYEYKEEGWTRFSLVEFVWLRCMTEMRNLSLSQQKIRIVKDNFFGEPASEFKAYLIESIEKFAGENENKEKILALFKKKELTDAVWEQAIEAMQASYFTLLVLQIIIYDQNVCFMLDKDDKFNLVILSETQQEIKKANDKSIAFLLNSSFSLINLRKIVKEFFSNDSIKYENDYIICFLRPKEKKIIEKIRKGGINEITIRFKNDEPTHMDVSDTVITESIINKVSRLLKKGEYNTITLKTHDGNLLFYNKTDKVRL